MLQENFHIGYYPEGHFTLGYVHAEIGGQYKHAGIGDSVIVAFLVPGSFLHLPSPRAVARFLLKMWPQFHSVLRGKQVSQANRSLFYTAAACCYQVLASVHSVLCWELHLRAEGTGKEAQHPPTGRCLCNDHRCFEPKGGAPWDETGCGLP